MTTSEIANRLITLCRNGEFETAQKELYADTAKSIEPYATPAFEKETVGLEKIVEKGHKFESMVEQMYGISVSEPLVTENSFAVKMEMDMAMKGQERRKFSEVCIYKVKDGKIVEEEFFV